MVRIFWVGIVNTYNSEPITGIFKCGNVFQFCMCTPIGVDVWTICYINLFMLSNSVCFLDYSSCVVLNWTILKCEKNAIKVLFSLEKKEKSAISELLIQNIPYFSLVHFLFQFLLV